MYEDFPPIFVDWLTVVEVHPKGGLPILVDGVVAQFDAFGNCRFERGIPARVPGSHDTSIRVRSDGVRVWLSGNVGRHSRQDNLFNFGWDGTKAACDRVLGNLGFPSLGASGPVRIVDPDRSDDGRIHLVQGAILSRIDLTSNYETGSDAQARAVIRWLAGRSVARMKRGFAGDESVWFSNTRHMLKAYISARVARWIYAYHVEGLKIASYIT